MIDLPRVAFGKGFMSTSKVHAEKKLLIDLNLASVQNALERHMLNEKAVSQAQQRAAGAALGAVRSGDTSGLKGASKSMANMPVKELKKYAGTKRQGLPAYKKKK